MSDMVNHPKHYNSHPTGIQCWDIAEPFGYFLGNAVKYIWRQGLKDDGQKGIQDLRKAIVYIEQEIKKREKASEKPKAPTECTECRGRGGFAGKSGWEPCQSCSPGAKQLNPQ